MATRKQKPDLETASPGPGDDVLHSAGDEAQAEDAAEAKPARHRTLVLRRTILDTAAEIFAERGFAGTNLRDIADALGMSRPGLYYHFPSKEKLLEAIVEELTFAAEYQSKQLTHDRNGEPGETLRLLVHATTLWLLDHQVFFRLLDRAEHELSADLRERSEASKRANLKYFVDTIERGIAQGVFRPVDPHVAALSIAGMRNWTAWWFKADGRLTPHQVADSIADLALRSVLRTDAHRSRSDKLEDVVRILQEDVSHLAYLIRE